MATNKKTSQKNVSKKQPPQKKGLSAQAQWGLIIGIGVLIVGVLVFNGVRDAADDGGDGIVTATGWDLPALDDDENPDNRIRIDDFSGTPTVVNFFASWCTACDDELPDFRDTAIALEGEVDFIFVNSNETGNWKPMAERNDIDTFTLAKDIQGTARNGLYRSLRGTGGMPMTAFYDADGNLVDAVLTAMNAQSLNARLAALGLI
jgi:thiol-disulfide isomerase/thioredoxin